MKRKNYKVKPTLHKARRAKKGGVDILKQSKWFERMPERQFKEAKRRVKFIETWGWVNIDYIILCVIRAILLIFVLRLAFTLFEIFV